MSRLINNLLYLHTGKLEDDSVGFRLIYGWQGHNILVELDA